MVGRKVTRKIGKMDVMESEGERWKKERGAIK